MHRWIFSLSRYQVGLASVATRSRIHLRILGCASPCRGKYTKSKNDDDDNVIEAEIIGEKNKKSRDMEEKGDGVAKSGGFLDEVMTEAGTWVGGLVRKAKEVMKMDEASIKKREQQKLVNEGVDRALRGTGLFGSILGGFMKQGLKIAAEAAAENAQDISQIQESVNFILLNDKKVIDAVGSDPMCSAPFAVAVNSMSINNKKSPKKYQLSLHVFGSKSAPAVTSVEATVSDGAVDIDKIYLRRPTDGMTISVDCSGRVKRRTVIDV